MLKTSIYLLFFEDDGLPLYVGKTSRSIEVRLKEHFEYYMNEFGKCPNIIELESVTSDPSVFGKDRAWRSAERKWILFFRSFNGIFDKFSLLNVASGGNASSGWSRNATMKANSKTARIKAVETMKANGRVWFSIETRRKASSKETRRKAVETQRKRKSFSGFSESCRLASKSEESLRKQARTLSNVGKEKHEIMNELGCSWKEAGVIRKSRLK